MTLDDCSRRQNLANIKLDVNNQVYYGHKLILAARSPVFAAMFKEKTLNGAVDCVVIDNIDNEIFDEMFRYIYTGNIPHFRKTVFSLLPAASKYKVTRLKTMCEIYLYNNLTIENVTNVLILADAHFSRKLKAKAIEFINENPKKVFATEGYKSMGKSHPHLLDECYQTLANMLDL